MRLHKPVTAVSANLKEACRLEIKAASLSGGVATNYPAQDMAFEIVDMSFDERSRFRRLLADNLSPTGTFEDTAKAAARRDTVVAV